MSVESCRAFSNTKYDYYELLRPLADVVPAGAIFVHDTDDNVYGSVANGCLKLCWTPDGNCYKGENHALCGGTVVLHSCFKNSSLFAKARSKDDVVKNKIDEILEDLCDSIGELREYLNKV